MWLLLLSLRLSAFCWPSVDVSSDGLVDVLTVLVVVVIMGIVLMEVVDDVVVVVVVVVVAEREVEAPIRIGDVNKQIQQEASNKDSNSWLWKHRSILFI